MVVATRAVGWDPSQLGLATALVLVRFMQAAAIARGDTAIGLGIEFIIQGTAGANLDTATGLGIVDRDTEAASPGIESADQGIVAAASPGIESANPGIAAAANPGIEFADQGTTASTTAQVAACRVASLQPDPARPCLMISQAPCDHGTYSSSLPSPAAWIILSALPQQTSARL